MVTTKKVRAQSENRHNHEEILGSIFEIDDLWFFATTIAIANDVVRKKVQLNHPQTQKKKAVNIHFAARLRSIGMTL